VVESEGELRWQDYLMQQAKEIVKHNQGKLTFNVGPTGRDDVSIFIEAGKATRFIVKRCAVEDD
jgi:hypothetical protein